MGWVFEYAVVGAQRTLAELRSIQDWFIRYQLTKAGGVAEVASVGGFVKQYQVVVDPAKLRAFGISLSQVTNAIRASNMEVGGSTIEMTEREYMVRGHGYLKGIGDLENVVLKSERGTPVLLKDLARVELGPDERRGLAELNGRGKLSRALPSSGTARMPLPSSRTSSRRSPRSPPACPKGFRSCRSMTVRT